jgi:hypothetical protein
MEPIFRELRIQTVRTQLAALHMECIALAKKLDAFNVTGEDNAALVHQWKSTMSQSEDLQTQLEKLISGSRAVLN